MKTDGAISEWQNEMENPDRFRCRDFECPLSCPKPTISVWAKCLYNKDVSQVKVIEVKAMHAGRRICAWIG